MLMHSQFLPFKARLGPKDILYCCECVYNTPANKQKYKQTIK